MSSGRGGGPLPMLEAAIEGYFEEVHIIPGWLSRHLSLMGDLDDKTVKLEKSLFEHRKLYLQKLRKQQTTNTTTPQGTDYYGSCHNNINNDGQLLSSSTAGSTTAAACCHSTPTEGDDADLTAIWSRLQKVQRLLKENIALSDQCLHSIHHDYRRLKAHYDRFVDYRTSLTQQQHSNNNSAPVISTPGGTQHQTGVGMMSAGGSATGSRPLKGATPQRPQQHPSSAAGGASTAVPPTFSSSSTRSRGGMEIGSRPFSVGGAGRRGGGNSGAAFSSGGSAVHRGGGDGITSAGSGGGSEPVGSSGGSRSDMVGGSGGVVSLSSASACFGSEGGGSNLGFVEDAVCSISEVVRGGSATVAGGDIGSGTAAAVSSDHSAVLFRDGSVRFPSASSRVGGVGNSSNRVCGAKRSFSSKSVVTSDCSSAASSLRGSSYNNNAGGAARTSRGLTAARRSRPTGVSPVGSSGLLDTGTDSLVGLDDSFDMSSFVGGAAGGSVVTNNNNASSLYLAETPTHQNQQATTSSTCSGQFGNAEIVLKTSRPGSVTSSSAKRRRISGMTGSVGYDAATTTTACHQRDDIHHSVSWQTSGGRGSRGGGGALLSGMGRGSSSPHVGAPGGPMWPQQRGGSCGRWAGRRVAGKRSTGSRGGDTIGGSSDMLVVDAITGGIVSEVLTAEISVESAVTAVVPPRAVVAPGDFGGGVVGPGGVCHIQPPPPRLMAVGGAAGGGSQDGDMCPICQRGELSDDDMVACDACQKWYHFICVHYAASGEGSEDWFCPLCITSGKAPSPVPPSSCASSSFTPSGGGAGRPSGGKTGRPGRRR
eukprot:GHVS01047088.1.p1 GENE.GHVS01047088.1~~GHVS01047088.1.p1  ORF type:complete len:818 (+),score=252.37 GHVS01047088.1:89-2542(+)